MYKCILWRKLKINDTFASSQPVTIRIINAIEEFCYRALLREVHKESSQRARKPELTEESLWFNNALERVKEKR